jgi:ATP-dependent Clp protease ATP-binding subunit ClpB
MRQDKLTARFQQALADAQSLALGRDHQIIEPAHVLLALIDQQGGTVKPLLVKAGGNLPKLRAELQSALDRLPKVQGAPGEVHVSNDLQRLLNVTDKLAQIKGDQYISSELFVLAAYEDKALLARLLKDSGFAQGGSREGHQRRAWRRKSARCQRRRKSAGAREIHGRSHAACHRRQA